MAMPLRPPSHWPTITKNNVSAVSRNVVRKTLIGPRPFLSAEPYLFRYAPPLRVVSTTPVRTSSSLSCHRGRPVHDRLAGFSPREFAAPSDPESFAEWSGAKAALHKPDHSLHSTKSPLRPA